MKTQSRLEVGELEYVIKNFYFSIEQSPHFTSSIRIVDLLDGEKCASYLDELTMVLQSPSRMITASQFAKRYAFLTLAPGLYAMTIYNKGLDLSIENSLLESSATLKKSWSARLCAPDLQVNEPAAGKRDEWRDETIRNLFAGHLAKLWRSISEAADIPMAILWENTAVRLYSLYEKRMGEGSDLQENKRIQEDFKYLISTAPGTLFGETDNPMARYYYPACTISSAVQPVRMRKTCCFYYKVSPDEGYCSNCPKVKHL
ncbi:hypothetical protein EXW96_05290 [Paenibacillus sp. JMULE4]|uniref:IucA/IucC family C-terminal-domain containing protein n=1 Tax=Paenibacillus sp. JMULE4 TaxID=2518342 RepID=UPI0015760124|nr:IucA/IucC family C-terminal-domain containing protein [Paenibacillus sp. JMULE4]NTZ16995.1 hypothetical protein [Paenibacillus sp. JMULE4]